MKRKNSRDCRFRWFVCWSEVLVTLRWQMRFIGCIDFIDVRNRSFAVASILIMLCLRTEKCIPLNESQTMQKDRLTAIVPLMIIKWKKNVCADPGFIDNGTHGWCISVKKNFYIFPCETHITIPLCWAWIMRAIEENFLNCITPSAAVE